MWSGFVDSELCLFVCGIHCIVFFVFFFFFKQKTAYEMLRSLVGSEMCIRDRFWLTSRQSRSAFCIDSGYTATKPSAHATSPACSTPPSQQHKSHWVYGLTLAACGACMGPSFLLLQALLMYGMREVRKAM
eukprot:TRINITY_DN11152_c0_g1_i6.p1 TRINITY_DN11152_c0_g1~~TRINITY_DN11152_c0_g1_i6.p1  ORF type:complete len:131 (-),score=23.34 TRINITY_DN11152_c0_g1_i6:105-497(-)